MDNSKAHQIRQDFPILDGITYLDSAATTQKPVAVIKAIEDHYLHANANIHRGIYRLSQDATDAYEGARRRVARFINAKPEEIVFTRSTTEAINLLSHSVPSIMQGNTIQLTELEHHSNLVPWQQLARRAGHRLKFAKVNPHYTLDYSSIDPEPGIMAFQMTSNAFGTRNDTSRLIGLARKAGALSIVDAAQGVPHERIDVKEMGCDFLAFSSHKMLGPSGIGVLYGKAEHLEAMPPFNYGGDMISSVSYDDAQWADIPAKFEAGTPNIEGAVGLGAAIKYLETIGMDNIQRWEGELLRHTLDRCSRISGIRIHSPGADQSAGILSFNLQGIHPHDISGVLDARKICIRAGHHCAMPVMAKMGLQGTARASFYAYNTLEDVEALCASIKEASSLLGRQ